MKKPFFYLLASLIFLIMGCSTATKQSVNQTITSAPTEFFTNSPTYLPSLKAPTLTHTPTQNLPTITLIPTLTTEEAKTKLFDLLRNNGGCNLPCIWGYTPEQTNRNELVDFFKHFVVTETPEISISKLMRNDRMSISFFVRLLSVYIDTGIMAYENEDLVEALIMDGSANPQWDASYAEVMKYYMLPQILTNYGKPSQILILTYRDDRQRPDVTAHPFYLVLLYPDQGFFVEYEMNREIKGDKFIGCPSKAFVSISTWNPQNDKAFEKITQGTRLDLYPDEYKSIYDATTMTTDEFFKVFSDPENKDCIQTLIEKWSNP